MMPLIQESKKRFMERKWVERKYHLWDNNAVELKDVKIYCNTNKFSELSFSDPHSKPLGTRGLTKHYHLRSNSKLGMGVGVIRRIPCACVACSE